MSRRPSFPCFFAMTRSWSSDDEVQSTGCLRMFSWTERITSTFQLYLFTCHTPRQAVPAQIDEKKTCPITSFEPAVCDDDDDDKDDDVTKFWIVFFTRFRYSNSIATTRATSQTVADVGACKEQSAVTLLTVSDWPLLLIVVTVFDDFAVVP